MRLEHLLFSLSFPTPCTSKSELNWFTTLPPKGIRKPLVFQKESSAKGIFHQRYSAVSILRMNQIVPEQERSRAAQSTPWRARANQHDVRRTECVGCARRKEPKVFSVKGISPRSFLRAIESNDNGYCAWWLRAIEVRVIYWLGTRAEMLRAFRFDSSVHMTDASNAAPGRHGGP